MTAFNDPRKEFYQSQLQQKMQDLEAVYRDLAIPQTQENERKLNNRAEQLLKEIEDFRLRSNMTSIRQINDSWDQHLYKIDYKKSLYRMKRVINNFSESSNAALFLIQQSRIFYSDYCIQHLRRELENCGVLDLPCSVRLPPGNIPIPDDFIRNLGEKLKVSLGKNDTFNENITRIIDKICTSLKGCNILFLEIGLEFVNPDDAFLEWLVKIFWHQLRSKMPRHIKVIGVVKIDRKLSKKLANLCCSGQSMNSDLLFPLAQEKWKEPEIYKWLYDFSCISTDDDILRNIAVTVFSNTNGSPDRARRLLLDSLKLLAETVMLEE